MTIDQLFQGLNSGSRWHRWEPHIHAPGTVLNDQFKGPDSWERYLAGLEAASPVIRGLGVTDYYSTDTYERVVEANRNGRLPGCDLIFPNIEVRLGVGTVKGRWVNLHLLVSPELPNHVDELKRFLQNLSFEAHSDTYRCNRDDLIRLGRRSDPSKTDPLAALEHGSQQFKVSFDQLRQVYAKNAWARDNILIAVAGSETDGTSGVRDAADATLRQEVEKFAHIIFASSAAQREFWLGRKPAATVDDICARYGNLKPCMHGSDAHEHDTIGIPDGKRFSWIKGAPAFDTLRQACIDPAGRAYVGDAPPFNATPSQVIAGVEIKDAAWAQTPRIALNPGLIAIIGARGSGKTALADIIAKGCDATAEHLNDSSFLKRAAELLTGTSVTLNWEEGESNSRMLDGSNEWSEDDSPRARYLSQKFVEDLCSATGMTDALLGEIERVIYEAHAPADRDGADSFTELREMRTQRFRDDRLREEEMLADVSERIGTELEKTNLIPGLKKQIEDKSKLIEGYTKDRAKLVSKGSEARVERLNALSAAAEKVRSYLRFFASKEQSLLSLQGEVSSMRSYGAAEDLRKLTDRHRATNLKPEEWSPFLLDYKGDVDGTITSHLTQARKRASDWKGVKVAEGADANAPLIADGADLEKQPLELLLAEASRVQRLINVDRETATKFAGLTKRIGDENSALQRLRDRLADAEGGARRAADLVAERESAYKRVFEAIVGEEMVLRELYKPLMDRLKSSSGTLNKLAFAVTRTADVATWSAAGEELLDLRKQGTFRGRGTLRREAAQALVPVWEESDPEGVSMAMAAFRAKNQKELLDHAPIPKTEQGTYRDWTKSFAKWLYGTDHISIQYSIDYDGVDIRKLSPGTRGIVLLLLYLALDDSDDRPLIIDQPEENLDPKSIFDELVGLFLDAKTKRQVIMVTHNANLVVNTDADQIIVAQAGVHAPGELPPITYLSGGLESPEIRKLVCDILEGGEKAFQERARRLRVSLNR